MKRIQGSKSVICTKKELKMMHDLCYSIYWDCACYELPLFSLTPEQKKPDLIETEYILVRPNNKKLTQTFFDRINKTWNKMYECWY